MPDGGTFFTLLDPSSEKTKKDETKVLHYAHPLRLDKTWCGEERDPVPYIWSHEPVSCPMCAYLQEVYGTYGWRKGRS